MGGVRLGEGCHPVVKLFSLTSHVMIDASGLDHFYRRLGDDTRRPEAAEFVVEKRYRYRDGELGA